MTIDVLLFAIGSLILAASFLLDDIHPILYFLTISGATYFFGFISIGFTKMIRRNEP